ncbi:tripartite tricarboxylate transporter substrate binding protein [Siccirubricoccus sp. KC 17139]|uniref:Tripartite tricarboxylate transporter substrate binding protein n=1 Tax=Siccirubricoccus soli TaxID=2899147 RepID=A0ABT1D3A4_9PROT|nr:tripartite tricarboxylate transporter substrate binding protein [Siccirubricoccus soli]MCO6416411.1 tripartite tricarboxylate transporter substrate binding protein [Siccirubricoccus soli]MCP2682545.1 tripartite tricarboxylate transporter substrate binding protein [Siccirubricoccus soli]
MRNGIPRRLLPAGLAAIGLAPTGRASPGLAQAPAWPSRPVRIIIPFTPGGSNDVIARPLAERLHARLGQPFVLENRPGAGSAVGVTLTAQAAPDGHTLLVTTSSVAAIGAVQGTGFDPAEELDAVALLARSPLVVLVPAASPLKDMAGLVAAERARPGSLHFASSGPGSTTHIAAELFNLRAGTKLQHVPYRGTAPALTDLVAGRVDVMFTTMASAAGQIRAGLLRILAYTGDDRPGEAPPAPSVKVAGIEYEAGIWWGLFAPRGLPPELLARLNAAANEVVAEPAYARHLAAEGALPAPLSPAAFAEFLRRQVAEMREVVAAARIKPD